VRRFFEIFVDKDALPGGANEGEPPIIVREVEVTADGRKSLGRKKYWRVRLRGPSTVVSDLDGPAPHVWIEAAGVTPRPRS